jgi:hypothetical protein
VPGPFVGSVFPGVDGILAILRETKPHLPDYHEAGQ